MGAAVTADMVSKNVFGLQPVFQFQIYHMMGLSDYWLTIILGIVLGIFGAIYNTGLLKLQKLYKNTPFLSDRNRIVVPFLFAGLAGLFFPYILGSGHHMMNLLTPASGIGFLLVLLTLKFLFSIISFSSGAPGGIFFPLLILGASVGSIVANACIHYLGLPQEIFFNIIILAMAGCFAAIVRAPITGIVLIMEMTGSLSHMLSLTIVSMVAFVVADLLGSEPIYDSLLDLLAIENDQEDLEEHSHKIIVEIMVRHNSIFENMPVCDIPWPDKSLLVSVKRGAKEMIPRGDTIIKTGDYLFILTDVNSEWNNRESLDHMNGTA
jgi:H+/Cl- antiporter ClcA